LVDYAEAKEETDKNGYQELTDKQIESARKRKKKHDDSRAKKCPVCGVKIYRTSTHCRLHCSGIPHTNRIVHYANGG
jgi:predicted RNA-binding Zn-ribbon protein involved in translation (DUF1610 family)